MGIESLGELETGVQEAISDSADKEQYTEIWIEIKEKIKFNI